MTPVHEAARSALTTTVLRDAASSSGWAYFAGKTPRLEPTLWALAALSHAPDLPRPFPELAEPHLRFLERAQRADGLLVDAPGMPPNLAWNGLAATVLAAVTPEALGTALMALGHYLAAARAFDQAVLLSPEFTVAADRALQARTLATMGPSGARR